MTSYDKLPLDATDDQIKKEIEYGMRQLSNSSITLKQFEAGIIYLKQRYSHKRICNLGMYILSKGQYTNYNITQDTTVDNIIYNELKDDFYIQDKELMLQLEQYVNKYLNQQIKNDLEKYTQQWVYFYPIDNKTIDAPEQITYNTLSDVKELCEQEAKTMRGTDYINQARGPKAYKHMRAMLQAIWNIQHKHPNSRFDIDINFQYDSYKLADHIKHNASEAEIDQAHRDAVMSYKGRGRPKGSRNKEKVVGKDTTEIDNILDDVLGDSLDDVSEDNSPAQEAPIVGDLSKFVTHPQLDHKAAKLRNDISRVADAINSAIRDEFNALESKVNNIQLHQPTLVEIKRNELPTLQMGVQHRVFSTLLKICTAQLRNGNRVIPWVYGPAGTGKSTAAENVAKALGLPYYSLGKTLAKFDLLGFINTTGYQTTEFRRAYENGGVFCADEMDAWSNEASVALNGALANGHCAFPDKSVKRHPDFVMITCANTTGAGATMDYVGRTKVDAATLDRFVALYWPLDEALEDSICANKDWLKYVRTVRAKANASGINPKPLITPRATIHGEALISAGMDWNSVVDICLRKGLSDAQWGIIK